MGFLAILVIMNSYVFNEGCMMKNIYSRMKIFHFKDKIDSLPKFNPAILPPTHIRIKPINACNHNCSYCSYRMEGQDLGMDMNLKDFIPRERMMALIDDIVECGVKAVTFSGGGEPLLYPYFLETIQKLSKTSIKFASLTNGSLLQGDIARLFSKQGTWIRISIDGWDDKSYAKYRGVREGEFSKVMENIKNFKKIGGKCLVGASVIVDKNNAPHVYELIMKLKDAGVDSIKVAPCIISNSGKENNSYHEPVFNIVKNAISRAKAELKGQVEIFDSYHTQLETFKKEYTWCPYMQIVPVIGADMNVYSCHDKAYTPGGILGSIKNRSFRDFWFSDKNTFFKINPSLDCNHHCMMNHNNELLLDCLDVNMDHLEFV